MNDRSGLMREVMVRNKRGRKIKMERDSEAMLSRDRPEMISLS